MMHGWHAFAIICLAENPTCIAPFSCFFFPFPRVWQSTPCPYLSSSSHRPNDRHFSPPHVCFILTLYTPKSANSFPQASCLPFLFLFLSRLFSTSFESAMNKNPFPCVFLWRLCNSSMSLHHANAPTQPERAISVSSRQRPTAHHLR